MAKTKDPQEVVKIKYVDVKGLVLPDAVKDFVWGEQIVIGKGQKSKQIKRVDAEAIIARSRSWTSFEEAEKVFKENPEAPKIRAQEGFNPGTFLAIVELVDADEKKG